MSKLSKILSVRHVGKIDETGGFVKGIVENNVKYLTRVAIDFDGSSFEFVL
tara:strand:- start:494 stop:646 length:153 start_codon:yes stop_codon:yes gene_type:complete